MKKMTGINLQEAFSGESQAHMKYLAFAEKAEKENFKNIARLFRANSYAEQIHAANHLRT
ncbi:MAG: ferritin family protein, partial [Acidobacteriota bacterium]